MFETPTKKHLKTFVSAALLLCALSQASQATTFRVETWGSDSNDGINNPWRNINKATNDARVQPGDTILVGGGSYYENVELGKSGNDNARITLKSTSGAKVIDPTPTDGWWQTGVIMAANKANWNIEGLRVEDASWGGITLRSCRNFTIQSCYTWRTGSSGIIALPYWNGGSGPDGEAEVNSRNIRVLDCTIEQANNLEDNATYTGSSGDQESLTLWGVDGFEIARCKVFNGKTEGIDVKTGSRNGTIHHNEVWNVATVTGLQGGTGIGRRNGGPGIYVEGGRAHVYNVRVYQNLVRDNKADAIAVADEDAVKGGVWDIFIYNNVTYNNGIVGVNSGAGVVVAAGGNVDVFMNTSVNDISGILVDGGSFGAPYPQGLEVRNNIFANSRYQNVRIQETNSAVFDNNLVTTQFNPPISVGPNNNNLSVTRNILVADAYLTSIWRLTPSSAAVSNATWTGNSGSLVAGNDYEGESRVQGPGPDIGADEVSWNGPGRP